MFVLRLERESFGRRCLSGLSGRRRSAEAGVGQRLGRGLTGVFVEDVGGREPLGC